MFSGHKPQSGYSISEEALRALQSGDTQALIDSHARFSGWRMEGDGDDDGDDDGSGDGDSGDSGAGDNNDGDGDDSSGDDDDDDDNKAALEAALKRMKAADQRAAKAEAELKKIEDGKKDDLTKAQDRVAELEAEVEKTSGTMSALRLQVAFLTTNKHTWHKPGAALKLAQAEGFLDDVISDDGTVDDKKMGSALDKLAKEHAYLVKTGDSGSGASGGSAGGRSGNGKDDKAVKEQDARRAPALSRRR